MPKPIIAVACLVAACSAQPTFAQHFHAYHGHHHLDHGHEHVYHYGSHHGTDRFHEHNDYQHGHAPHSLRYVDLPVPDVYSVPIAGSSFDQGYSNFDTVCPNAVACPLQYQNPAPLAPMYQPRTPYAAIPNQRSIPNDHMNPNDHAGHDHSEHAHSDHSHDGHKHENPSLPPSNLPGTFDGPDRQPMTAPTLPNRGRLSEPPIRGSVPRTPETNNGSIRMNEPPPPSLTFSAGKPSIARS
ncbi:hypothetical protein Pla22_42070 [Rubripirellula amarantea]|uniref:Uncharacterized protein n=1 Tax=Rubripirellula amarantea TaxID=2527999 RepID=A0A5C5WMW8_9BACT|nr:hypothetical protein [Rubripirellula amarantea]TWT51429.1 hypothetical protein Pla22_42070 [Rubripirellula amarantea]